MSRHVTIVDDGRSAYRISTHTHTVKRHLGRPMGRWEDNIRMDLK